MDQFQRRWMGSSDIPGISAPCAFHNSRTYAVTISDLPLTGEALTAEERQTSFTQMMSLLFLLLLRALVRKQCRSTVAIAVLEPCGSFP